MSDAELEVVSHLRAPLSIIEFLALGKVFE